MSPIVLRGFVSVLAASGFALAALYEHPTQLPTKEYDYIVVGGGTAGNVVANRLTEDKNVTVLVLEAGGSNEGVLFSQIPLLCTTLTPFTALDWNYTTVPQVGMNDRILPYARGFVLGGSSTVNIMVYNRGSKDDFDKYARIAKDKRWSWDAVAKYWSQRFEHFIPPSDNRNTTARYDPSVHSTTGKVDVSLTSYRVPLDDPVIKLTKENPEAYPYQLEPNDGDPIGLGWAQATIGYGKRSSSATAYLAPKYIARPNLSVLLHARATKIVQTGTSKGVPQFGAVDFAISPDGISSAPSYSRFVTHDCGSSHYSRDRTQGGYSFGGFVQHTAASHAVRHWGQEAS